MATATQIQAMVYGQRCPLCQSDLRQRSYSEDVQGAVVVVEWWWKCPKGCWETGSSYGRSETNLWVNGVHTWFGRFDDSEEVVKTRENQIADMIIAELRRRAELKDKPQGDDPQKIAD